MSWLCDLGWVLQVHVGEFESVYLNSFSLSSNIDMEGVRTRLDDLEGAFIGTLERCAISVTMNEDKFSLL